MSRARLAGLLTLAASACHENQTLAPPPLQGAASLLFVVEQDNEVREAYVLKVTDSLPQIAVGPDIVLHVATYSLPLDGYGITTPSVLDPRDVDAQVVPTPERAYTLVPSLSRDWSAVAEIPPIWARVRAPRTVSNCDDFTRFETKSQQIPDSHDQGPLYMVKRFGDVAIVGNTRGIWSVAQRDNRIQSTSLLVSTSTTPSKLGFTGTPTAPLLTGMQDPNFGGGVWFYQKGGQLWNGDFIDMDFRKFGPPAPSAPSAESAWMTMSGGSSEFEVYILDSDGNLLRYDLDGWSTILAASPSDPKIDWQGGVVWLSPRHVFAIGPRGGSSFDVRGATVSVVTLAGYPRFTYVTNTRSGGLYAGDSEGKLWRNEADIWMVLDTPPGIGEIVTIQPFLDGVLYGGQGGLLSYFSDQQPGCGGEIRTPATSFAVAPRTRTEHLIFSSSGLIGDAGPITVTAVDTDP